ncbi:glycoside hydrolase family 128 protein [Hyaloscypha variabilis F]|uniref:Glycoside hydrolase family 128 protein n=1 Tax=Hyaloscypha variabilis (strain UAMH 11265 / GT02V1 / F) TaxID=1149755 RepID=A0A2J6RFT7_HYAVF|nr:glycoside hydrolase family 128 protein [Hyaloscypha variabilis F]
MVIRKRCLLWDWTNTANLARAIEKLNFDGPFSSVSNWNAWSPPELKNRLPFRPTVRGMDQLTDPNEWGMISNNDHAIIHYFNEPERAGISPQKAAEMWKDKMVPLRKERGKKIVGPGCASDSGGEAWLDDFMKKIQDQGEPPDYLGLHYYGPDAGAAIRYIEKMHQKYPEYPVVVSEIASISRDKKDVFAFTAQVANWMDECPYVFEYSFFGCMAKCADDFVSPEAQLMNSDGTFTHLMEKLMNEQPITI